MRENLDRLVRLKQMQLEKEVADFPGRIEAILEDNEGFYLEHLANDRKLYLSWDNIGLDQYNVRRLMPHLPELIIQLNKDNDLVVCSLRDGKFGGLQYVGIDLVLKADEAEEEG